jgi:hypothetical protein
MSKSRQPSKRRATATGSPNSTTGGNGAQSQRKASEPTISNKDYKLLWGRAAARCAFADCRTRLTEAEGAATYGNVCHIVAESPNGPRGQSILTKAQRNSYPNLILLCSHHHDVIDADPTGPQNYPPELLHGIKAEHELWVEGALAPQADVAQVVYATVVDEISIALDLDSWNWFSDHAVRDLLPFNALEGAQHMKSRRLQIVWPGKKLTSKRT